MLVNLNTVLADARKNRYAVGLFNTTDTDMLEAVIADCEAGRMVQEFDYHRTVSAEHGHMAYLRINVAGSGDFSIEVWENAVLTCKWLKENLEN